MKRLFTILMVLFLCLFSGCTGQENVTQMEANTTVTESAPTETTTVVELVASAKYTRLSEEPILELVASEDYGCILPFCGTAPDFDSRDLLYADYGFMDASGRIVVDPVYQYVSPLEVGDGYASAPCVWKLTQGEVKQAPQMVGYYYIENERCGMATGDGSVVIDLIYDVIFAQGNHIFAITYLDEMRSECDLDIYNFSCEKVGSLSHLQYHPMGFSEGILRVCTNWQEWYYMDLTGCVLAGPFLSAEDFSCGYGLVEIERTYGSLYTYVDKEGNLLSEDGWVFRPEEGEPFRIFGFENAEPFVNGVACVQVNHNWEQYNILTPENEFLFDFELLSPYMCTEEYILNMARGDTEVYSHEGELLWYCEKELQALNSTGAPLLYDAEENKIYNWQTGEVYDGIPETTPVRSEYGDFPYYIFSVTKTGKQIYTDENLNVLWEMDGGFITLRDAVTGNCAFVQYEENGQRITSLHLGTVAEGIKGEEVFVYNDMILAMDSDSCNYYNMDGELVFCYPYITE